MTSLPDAGRCAATPLGGGPSVWTSLDGTEVVSTGAVLPSRATLDPVADRDPSPEGVEHLSARRSVGPRHASSTSGRFIDHIAERKAPPTTFARTIGGTIAGTLVPGLGFLLARRKVAGAVVLLGFLAAVYVIVASVAFERQAVLALLLKPTALRVLAGVLAVAAITWVCIIVLTHLWLRPANLSPVRRGIGGALVAVLAFLVAAPLAVGAVYAGTSAHSMGTVFKSTNDAKSATRPSNQPSPEAKDPWAGIDRVNILLLGGDSDGGRREGVRTDTVMVASINTRTGDTTLISLPRNTGRMPFPADSVLHQHYPNGFTNGNGADAEFMLNAMYDNVPATLGKDILGPTDNVGADVLKLAVGEAIGLKIDYYVLIDIRGFTQMIDALGGITINVSTRVAMGGSVDKGIPPKAWLEPGPNQHLNGTQAMWFARGRYSDADGDFDRMDRQRCVIDAMIKQVNPANVVTRYEAIAREGGNLVLTDITQEELAAFVELSLRVKGGQVRSVVFKNAVQGFVSANPNFAMMRQRVATAIEETSARPGSTPTSPTSPPSSTAPSSPPSSKAPGSTASSKKPSSPGSTATSTPPASEDTTDVCAYRPA